MRFYLFFSKHAKVLLFIILLLFSLYSTYLYLTKGQVGGDDVLVVLSSEFLKWNVDLPRIGLPPRDISNYFQNFYVYFGPLPSILLIPFTYFFGTSFPQVSIGVSAMIMSFVAVYLITRQLKFSRIDSLWLSLFFVFSTVLFSSSVINITAYQVEAFGVPFILFSIWVYFAKRNVFIIGLFIALATMTRFTLMLAVIFFFIELLYKRISIKQFIFILLPVLVVVLLLGAYNHRRFNSFFETGYNYNISKDDFPIGKNLIYGDISIKHIPANLYSFLVMAPEPLFEDNGGFSLKFPYLKANPWGIAIWFTSPLFILLIARFRKGMYTFSSGITAFFLSLPVFLWYSIGFAQFGYRYSLDFLPFIFLMLFPSIYPRLTKTAIVLIILGVLFNCIYSNSIWEVYPVFNIYP